MVKLIADQFILDAHAFVAAWTLAGGLGSSWRQSPSGARSFSVVRHGRGIAGCHRGFRRGSAGPRWPVSGYVRLLSLIHI